MNDKNFFMLSIVFLLAIVLSAFLDYDYLSMGLSFVAMGLCSWYIKTRTPQ